MIHNGADERNALFFLLFLKYKYIYLFTVFRWGYLSVKTDSGYSDDDQSYAAGLVEGFLTAPLIKMHWTNTVAGRSVHIQI